MPDKFDPQVVKDAWANVSAGASVAVKDPSLIMGVAKEVVSFGTTAFKFFAIAENANDLRKLWRDKEEKKKHGLLGRIGLSIVYAGNIAASSIAAAVVLGASVVAAPVAAAIVSGTSLVKSTVDFLKESLYVRKLKKESAQLEDELKKANVSFEANTALYHDLENTKANIKSLEAQKENVAKMLAQIAPKETTAEDPQVLAFLAEEARELQSELTQKSAKHNILAKEQSKDRYLTTTIEGNIKRTQEKADLYQVSKNELVEQLKTAKSSDKPVIEEKMKLIDDKINKYTTLKSHYEKIQNLETMLDEVREQKKNIPTKYNSEPYKGGTVSQETEQTYLNLREAEIKAELEKKKEPATHLAKSRSYQSDAQALNPNQGITELRAALTENLEKQKKDIEGKIEGGKKNLEDKEKFASLFTKDPKQSMIGDAKALYNKSLEAIDKRNEVKLAKMDRNKKAKSIGFAAAGFALAVSICVPALWPVAGILTLTAAAVGVVYGVSSLWDKYQKSKTEKAMKKEKGAEAIKLLTKIDDHMKDKKEKENEMKTELSSHLHSRMEAITSSGQPQQPTSHEHLTLSNPNVLTQHTEARRASEAKPKTSTTEPVIEVTAPRQRSKTL
ncbi:hypothetical protein [Candidatus Berkiella aquae]|uniref:Uncharacterized protein n=1 Tax=Candidatus Berkiella aquae TaxID=295108 RepID=A0A0Q9YZZ0_9GAMM|nr:hypothetical protein [Candidatus Berkiella aquae]MCS5710529.1 hypothetical protein [Candidatus Berkiella aquae]